MNDKGAIVYMRFNIERDEKYLEELKGVLEREYEFNIRNIEVGERGLERRNMEDLFERRYKSFCKDCLYEYT